MARYVAGELTFPSFPSTTRPNQQQHVFIVPFTTYIGRLYPHLTAEQRTDIALLAFEARRGAGQPMPSNYRSFEEFFHSHNRGGKIIGSLVSQRAPAPLPVPEPKNTGSIWVGDRYMAIERPLPSIGPATQPPPATQQEKVMAPLLTDGAPEGPLKKDGGKLVSGAAAEPIIQMTKDLLAGFQNISTRTGKQCKSMAEIIDAVRAAECTGFSLTFRPANEQRRWLFLLMGESGRRRIFIDFPVG